MKRQGKNTRLLCIPALSPMYLIGCLLFSYKETIIFDFTSSGSSDSSFETLIVMLI